MWDHAFPKIDFINEFDDENDIDYDDYDGSSTHFNVGPCLASIDDDFINDDSDDIDK